MTQNSETQEALHDLVQKNKALNLLADEFGEAIEKVLQTLVAGGAGPFVAHCSGGPIRFERVSDGWALEFNLSGSWKLYSNLPRSEKLTRAGDVAQFVTLFHASVASEWSAASASSNKLSDLNVGVKRLDEQGG